MQREKKLNRIIIAIYPLHKAINELNNNCAKKKDQLYWVLLIFLFITFLLYPRLRLLIKILRITIKKC